MSNNTLFNWQSSEKMDKTLTLTYHLVFAENSSNNDYISPVLDCLRTRNSLWWRAYTSLNVCCFKFSIVTISVKKSGCVRLLTIYV